MTAYAIAVGLVDVIDHIAKAGDWDAWRTLAEVERYAEPRWTTLAQMARVDAPNAETLCAVRATFRDRLAGEFTEACDVAGAERGEPEGRRRRP